jgi:hypothetical protein
LNILNAVVSLTKTASTKLAPTGFRVVGDGFPDSSLLYVNDESGTGGLEEADFIAEYVKDIKATREVFQRIASHGHPLPFGTAVYRSGMVYITTGCIRIKAKGAVRMKYGFRTVTRGQDPIARYEILNVTEYKGTEVFNQNNLLYERECCILEHVAGETHCMSTVELGMNVAGREYYAEEGRLLAPLFIPYEEQKQLRGCIDLSKTVFNHEGADHWIVDKRYQVGNAWEAITRPVLPRDIAKGEDQIPKNPLCFLAPHDVWDGHQWNSVVGNGPWKTAFDECHLERFGKARKAYDHVYTMKAN